MNSSFSEGSVSSGGVFGPYESSGGVLGSKVKISGCTPGCGVFGPYESSGVVLDHMNRQEVFLHHNVLVGAYPGLVGEYPGPGEVEVVSCWCISWTCWSISWTCWSISWTCWCISWTCWCLYKNSISTFIRNSSITSLEHHLHHIHMNHNYMNHIFVHKYQLVILHYLIIDH